jgi:hypothetical protein
LITQRLNGAENTNRVSFTSLLLGPLRPYKSQRWAANCLADRFGICCIVFVERRFYPSP